MAVAICDRTTVHVGAIGAFSAVAIRTQVVQRLVTPIRLIDEFVSRGVVPAAEAANHRYRHWIVGPYFGMEGGKQLNWVESTGLGPGDRIVLGGTALPHFLDKQKIPINTWDAEQLRDEVERCGGSTSPTGIVTIGAGTG